MKDLLLLSLFGLGGIGVIITYYILYLYGAIKKYGNYFTKKELRVWAVSVLLTIASVIGLILWFSIYQELEDWKRVTFIVSLVCFLIFASLWSVSLAHIHSRNASPYIQQPILILVALATIGMLVATAYSTDKWLVITAAAIIVFHHLFFDAFYWMYIVDRETRKERNLTPNSQPVKNTKRPKKGQNV